MKTAALRALALLVFLLPSAAFAHTGIGDTLGFVYGFMHPVGGLDHVLAMVAAGLFAAHLGGRALWIVPASFVSVMAIGGALGGAGISIPYAETGIAISVVVLGLIVAYRTQMPLIAAAALVGLFAVFHGHAHGAELPAAASGIAYGAGFLIATALLHIAGIGLGLALERLTGVGARLVQAGGGATAVAGAVILLRVL